MVGFFVVKALNLPSLHFLSLRLPGSNGFCTIKRERIFFLRVNLRDKKYLGKSAIFIIFAKKLVCGVKSIAFINNQGVVHIIHTHHFVKHAVVAGVHNNFARFESLIIVLQSLFVFSFVKAFIGLK